VVGLLSVWNRRRRRFNLEFVGRARHKCFAIFQDEVAIGSFLPLLKPSLEA